MTGIVLSSSASWHSGERADAESLFVTRDQTARQSVELTRGETEDTEQPTEDLPSCTEERFINSRHIANFENSAPDSFHNDANLERVRSSFIHHASSGTDNERDREKRSGS